MKLIHDSDIAFIREGIEMFGLSSTWPLFLLLLVGILILHYRKKDERKNRHVIDWGMVIAWSFIGFAGICFIFLMANLSLSETMFAKPSWLKSGGSVISEAVESAPNAVASATGKVAKEGQVPLWQDLLALLLALWAGGSLWFRRRRWNAFLSVALIAVLYTVVRGKIELGLGASPPATGQEFSLGQIPWFNLVLGAVIALHFFWRHKMISPPQEWNIDPEASVGRRGPQKHWYGIWGNALFHLCLFCLLGPLMGFFWKTKVLLLYPALALLSTVFALHFRMETVKDIRKKTDFRGESSKKDDRDRKAKRLEKAIKLATIGAASLMVVSFFGVKVPISFLFVSLLPLAWILGGVLEVHIRGLLVPTVFKKPIFNEFWLLGLKYLGNGLHIILIPVWLWRLKIIPIDFAAWEIGKITTPDVPTRKPREDELGEDGDKKKGKPAEKGRKQAGLPVKIDAKVTVQRYYPERFLALDDSQRTPGELNELIRRYVLGALRDITTELTYDQAKIEDWYQYKPRLHDIGPDDKEEYNHKAQHLTIKVVEGSDGEGQEPKYVRQEEKGVFRQATFFEYLDWILAVNVGCRLLNVDILDVTASDDVEGAEERRYIARLEKVISKDLGEAKGLGRKAEIEKVMEILKDEDSARAVEALQKLIGAEKAGMVFQLVQGLNNKLSKDS